MSQSFAVKFRFCFALVLFALQLVGCVTTRRREPVDLPVVFQPLFSSCAPLDGDASMIARKDDAAIFSSSMVWLFENNDQAEIQFNSPIGETIFQISRKSDRWIVEGNVDFEVLEDSQGVLSVNGHDIPLRAHELGCVLSGFWPADWLNSLYFEQPAKGSILLKGSDSLRDIELTLTVSPVSSLGRVSDIKSCAVLRWGGFLGLMKRSLLLCREKTQTELKMSLSGVNGFAIDWKIVNE